MSLSSSSSTKTTGSLCSNNSQSHRRHHFFFCLRCLSTCFVLRASASSLGILPSYTYSFRRTSALHRIFAEQNFWFISSVIWCVYPVLNSLLPYCSTIKRISDEYSVHINTHELYQKKWEEGKRRDKMMLSTCKTPFNITSWCLNRKEKISYSQLWAQWCYEPKHSFRNIIHTQTPNYAMLESACFAF